MIVRYEARNEECGDSSYLHAQDRPQGRMRGKNTEANWTNQNPPNFDKIKIQL